MNLLLLEPSDFISGSVVRISGRRLRQLADVIRAEPGKRCKAGLLNGLTGTAELLSITPETAVISVGYNTYGHPTQKVLDRLAKYEITVLRTDTDGEITIAAGEG